jgi:hypothetical protein
MDHSVYNSLGILFVLGLPNVPISIALVCWGRWGDRSKGRARCPQCWYDMRGTVPKLECPECGHDAQLDVKLYQDRIRRGAIYLGVAFMALWLLPVLFTLVEKSRTHAGESDWNVLSIIPMGVVLILWGLLADRTKRRPRCPKCQADMGMSTPLPPLVCRTCGLDAALEDRLYQDRIFWLPTIIGAMLTWGVLWFVAVPMFF